MINPRFLFVLILLIWLSPAHAQTSFDYIFQTGKAATLNEGEAFRYQQTKTDKAQSLKDQKRALQVTVDGDMLKLTLYEGEKYRRMGQYPKAVGSPVHMYFLESIIADMQADTGGSNYYIRNRLKAALSETDASPQACGDALYCLELSPFAEDEARDKMGGFADLKLRFVVDENHPLWVVSMSAQNPQNPDQYAFSLEIE